MSSIVPSLSVKKESLGLSIIIPTLNAEAHIARALKSVSFADELWVIDCGSTDSTCEIAEELGATLIHQPWLGYGAQKNKALARVQTPWVLFLDADECLSEELVDNLRLFLASPGAYEGARLWRYNHYLGKALKFAWPPELKLRLIKKGSGQWSSERVHEVLGCQGPVVELCGRLEHRSYRNISEHVERIHRYSQLSAQDMQSQGRRGGLLSLIFRPPAFFFKSYCLRLGFLEGYRGLLIAILGAYYTFLRFKCLRRRIALESAV